ncbi:MAG: hypothetical protein A2Z40_03650 [Deltaproteobacteria bacterium RBG_19FT_COMBO_60_16]|nr:MAG: hypothetical protein A2Z40_03650 [Deltaproteobacteria bacterium RBG_19FT_COMBO_60_16]
MTIKKRLKKIEDTIRPPNQPPLNREVLWWEPTDPESTKLVNEKVFSDPQGSSKYEVRIVGVPEEHHTGEDFDGMHPLETPEELRALPFEEKKSRLDKIVAHHTQRINEYRKRLGLPAVFTKDQPGVSPEEKDPQRERKP